MYLFSVKDMYLNTGIPYFSLTMLREVNISIWELCVLLRPDDIILFGAGVHCMSFVLREVNEINAIPIRSRCEGLNE